jgi:hypothetical protein
MDDYEFWTPNETREPRRDWSAVALIVAACVITTFGLFVWTAPPAVLYEVFVCGMRC